MMEQWLVLPGKLGINIGSLLHLLPFTHVDISLKTRPHQIVYK